MDTDTTNPVDGGDTSVADTAEPETGVDAEVQQADEPQYDDDGNVIEPDEEVELDDLKLTVPKSAAAKLKELQEGNLRQADYTRKTQEVAEERRAILAERQSMHQISQAEFQAAARADSAQQMVARWDAHAAQFGGWAAWARQDPFAAQEADLERKELERDAGGHLSQLSNLRNQRLSAEQQETAKRIDQGREVLAREVPGWSPDLKAKLIDFAGGYGFSRAELDDLEADPRVARVLHAAFAGSKTTQAAKKVQNHVAAQAVQPAAKVGTSKAPPQGLDDRTSIDTWMERRNAQTRRKRA